MVISEKIIMVFMRPGWRGGGKEKWERTEGREEERRGEGGWMVKGKGGRGLWLKEKM